MLLEVAETAKPSRFSLLVEQTPPASNCLFRQVDWDAKESAQTFLAVALVAVASLPGFAKTSTQMPRGRYTVLLCDIDNS